jgi:hypothetical protein
MEKDPQKIQEIEQAHEKFFGRPTKYTEELGAKICEMIAIGKSIKEIEAACDVKHITWELWRDTKPDFSSAYRCARKASVSLKMDQLAHIADDDSKDILYDPTDGHIVINSSGVGRSRERASALRLWLGYTRGCQARGLTKAKTAEEVIQVIQEHLEAGEISHDEAEKLCKLAESKAKLHEQSELKPMLQEALDKIAKYESSK